MLNIRPADQAQDREQAAQLMAATDPWLTLNIGNERALAMMHTPGREHFIAELDGAFAGFLVLNCNGPLAGYLQTVGVTESCRGRGIGSVLVGFAEQRIFRDHANVFLCVSSFNQGAQRLYRRLGYETVGELGNYLVDGQSELLMRKTRGPILDYTPPPTV